MSNYYIDITSSNRDFGKAFTQVHMSIVSTKLQIGCAFPLYRYNNSTRVGNVGLVLRLFAQTEEDFHTLDIASRVEAFSEVTAIQPVPANVLGYCSFSRVRRKSMSDIRRSARRAVAAGRFDDMPTALEYMQRENVFQPVPALFMYSHSTQRMFPLHVKVEQKANPVAGEFNTFGLSETATVPVF